MKQTLIKTAVLVFAISFSLASCKKDKAETKNSFKYNQKESVIGTAMGFHFGLMYTGVYAIGVEFLENSLTVNYVSGSPDSFTGKGDVFDVYFLTDKETEITTGVYNYLPVDSTTTSLKAFSIIGASASALYINVDAASGTNQATLDVTGGKVTVTKNADEYEFTFDLKTSVNSTITGYYKGKPVIYAGGKKKSTISANGFSNPFR